MRIECGEAHPDFADIICDVTVPHPWHRGWSVAVDAYVDWTNEAYVMPITKERMPGKLKEMASRVAPAPRVDDDEPPCRREPQTCGVERNGHFCWGDGMDPDHEIHECRCRKTWKSDASGFLAGLAGSERAARKWSDTERILVLQAIIEVARRMDEFTTDDIWDELAGRVPVTKGMTAMLKRADRKGILGNTGKTVISNRGGQHDHGQRLSVWYSLIKKKVQG